MKFNRCSGGKRGKIRVTGLATAKLASDKLPIFVVGKSNILSRLGFKNSKSSKFENFKSDIVKHELRVTSCELRVTSYELQVKSTS